MFPHMPQCEKSEARIRNLPMRITIPLTIILSHTFLFAADQPQWGRAWDRNMVSTETGLPETFDLATGKNVKWVADLGTHTHGTPIVADGRVFISTNNGRPRNPQDASDAGVLMSFGEKDGAFLSQLAAPKLTEDPYLDWPKEGQASPATVEGGRIYVVNNRTEVLCLDAGDLARPPIWRFDMREQAGIWPHDGSHSSILIRGSHLYLNTGTGVDNSHRKIRTPDAPSLIVLDKATGRYLARDREGIAPNIFHATWSAPSMAEVAGKEMIFFCGGNGITYAFEPISANAVASGEPQTLKKIWQYDLDPEGPKTDVHRFTQNKSEGPSNIYGMPVVVDGRLYIAGGGDIFWGKNKAWLKCVDAATGTELWSYALNKHVLSTAAVANGLVFIADIGRTIHCVDAATGAGVWTESGPKGDFWASPMVADGKLYIGTRKGDFWIMAASREKKVHATLNLGSGISGTATVANGVVFVATMKQLIAFGK
jgi:outer membrane protein assembly factor BamB